MTALPNARSIDRLDIARSGTRTDGLRLGERVAALRERLESRADAREAAQLRADVRDARDFVRGFNSRDVSDSTATRYARVVAQMREAGQRPEDAACKNTFEFRRAAYVHVARTDLKGALRDLDKHRRTGDVARAAEAYNRVKDGLGALRQYPPTTGSREADLMRSSAFRGPTHPNPERSNGKRGSLTNLPPDWRDAVQREARDHDRPALAALSLTGCRPAEVRGIRVHQDDDSVTLTIRGAKVDRDRGVESRSITLDRDELNGTQAGRDLAAWLGAREQRTIAYPGSVEAFRERVSRAADRAGLSHVSAYTYRHAAARELKAARASRAEIADRLGHRSERSQSVYG
ncbi:tyrosine-type recombinase/integrase [Burkholderia ubonensis]|uniref:tyrosine-type recombinase/integrase n=1 Tax=Burkholderia ubonensis TaxID=101571 RepID=UPI0009B2FE7E|nr:tyrosine-type recombinase/integrase [Burkholderia ubonensis]